MQNDKREKDYGIHVLLAEDDEINLEVFVELLNLLGCTVDIARNGQELVDMFDPDMHQILFVDISMPVMDGLESTKKILERLGPDKKIVIVAVTAHAFPEDREACLNAGMDDYIPKPAVIGDFKQVLDKYADRFNGE